MLNVENDTISEVLSEDLKYITGLSWLTHSEITFSSMVKVPGSDSVQFQLFIANVETQQIRSVLPGIYGRKYAWSVDHSWIAYSDTGDTVYITPSSIAQPRKIWQSRGLINDISWSPDSRFILITGSDPIDKTQDPPYVNTIWIIAQDGSAATKLTGP